MDALDIISGPILFVQQVHEHSKKVHQGVELMQPLVDALFAEDYEKIKTLHKQMSEIKNEADQIKLSLYDQIKDMHFRSAGGYAFSQYITWQDKVADSAMEFADLLMLRKTTIPVELRADFQAFVAQVVNISGQVMNLAEKVCSPAEDVLTEPEDRDTLDAIGRIIEGNCEVKRLAMEFAFRIMGTPRMAVPFFVARPWSAPAGLLASLQPVCSTSSDSAMQMSKFFFVGFVQYPSSQYRANQVKSFRLT
ncbi:MAG: DUF47 family protein [Planctomycetota bacterium]|nr:DUF47 family protein [Planctomycetota bacterium]